MLWKFHKVASRRKSKILVSPPPVSVITTQTTLTDQQSTIFRGKKPKATTKVTLTSKQNAFNIDFLWERCA